MVLALVVVLGVVACGSDENEGADSASAAVSSSSGSSVLSGPESPTSTSDPLAATTTASAASSEEAEIIAAVLGYWDTVLAANSPPNPEHPDLEKYASGRALEVALANINRRRALGQGVRLPEPTVSRHSPVVESIAGDSVTVLDCSVDDGVLVDLASGLVLNDAVSTNKWRTTLDRIDGDWKVVSNELLWSADGVVSCAAP